MKKYVIYLFTVFLSVVFFSCKEEIPTDEKTEFLWYALSSQDSNYKSKAFLIQNNFIHIMAPLHSDLTSLTHEFSINGKYVYVDEEEQHSGQESYDFSDFTNPLTYRIVSSLEEEKEWTVNVYDLPVLIINTPDGEPIIDKENRKEGCSDDESCKHQARRIRARRFIHRFHGDP